MENAITDILAKLPAAADSRAARADRAVQRSAAETCLVQIERFVASVGVVGAATSLTQDELARALASRSDATLEALALDLECFRRFCLATGVKGIPAAHEDVARYIERLWQKGPVVPPAFAGKWQRKSRPLKPASIQRRLSSIAMLHQLLKLPNPCDEANVRNAMRIARRTLGTKQRQAAAVRLEAVQGEGPTQGQGSEGRGFTVDVLLAACDDSLGGLRDAALISMAYDGGFRVSELLACSLGRIEGLDRSEGQGTYRLAASKTDQEGQGTEVPLSAETMRRLRAWVAAAAIDHEPALPLFRRIQAIVRKGNKGRPARRYADLAPNAGFSVAAMAAIPPRAAEVWHQVSDKGLSRAGVTLIYRRTAQRAADMGLVDLMGEELEQAIAGISTHSMRVGLTLDLFRLGMDGLRVTEALRWKDPKTALRYARNRPSSEKEIADVLAGLRA